ncbi:MAG: hypothetical protein ACYCYH_13020 [Steroidobacteraceae bacterium]
MQLVHALSLERLLVKDLQTGETRIVARAAVSAIETYSSEPDPPPAAGTKVNDEQLARLTAREQMLKPYLGGRELTRKEARRLGGALAVYYTQVGTAFLPCRATYRECWTHAF